MYFICLKRISEEVYAVFGTDNFFASEKNCSSYNYDWTRTLTKR